MVALERGILYNEKDIDYDAGIDDGSFSGLHRWR